MCPQFLITLGEDPEPKPRHRPSMRVLFRILTPFSGYRCRGTSGQTAHNLWPPNLSIPVRLATSERAELATEEDIPFTSVLEGFVLLLLDGVVTFVDTMPPMYFHHF